ncbi:LOW QUALITY PROTEIN: homocysteine-responsive endoplasmic reticulum-resident ubiquitin-like domain member 2 protein [Drosophila gunungcola]|uniref:LOW QUALITY PROTEIN: homocysteine-responsive endoplasmic reticulum-resident ubiquitin-like domain member 2 protein n=1 Tax=Drosophila gunungcola TaxID=103775 RepID=UPI0022E77C67|nr:LOW QUALITY PROTEIN: homocysteine-responsive endoplasmic reticulum-resident ubiquitin-like domain member 2 protein [Drosophila gunungcola]
MEETASPAASPAAATAAGCDAAAREKTPDSPISASGSSVRLLIKSSNQQYEDLNVDSDLCWTVQRLKKQLSLVYPGKPKIQDQKLIYSGKLLDDSQKISEVIRSYKDVYQQHHIFHLVCATKQVITPPAKTIPVPPKDAVPAPQDASGNANELRQRHPTQQQPTQQAGAAFPMAGDIGSANPWALFWQQNQAAAALASANANPQAIFQQQALMYNAWMQQVYAQYMQQYALRSTLPGSNGSVLPPLPQVPLIAARNFADAQPVAGAVAAPPAQAPPAPQINGAPLNRPNFPNIQEEPEMRDWLDSFFSFTRLAIFVTVLYFNSSPMRCLLVVLIAGAIYLYHIGVLRRRRERNNNNINRNNNADDAAAFAAVQQIQRMMDAAVERENNDPQAANEPGAVPAAGPADAAAGQDAVDAPAAAAPVPASAANPDSADLSAEAVAVEPPNANNSVISVVRTFVITFFTSLLPEAPAL